MDGRIIAKPVGRAINKLPTIMEDEEVVNRQSPRQQSASKPMSSVSHHRDKLQLLKQKLQAGVRHSQDYSQLSKKKDLLDDYKEQQGGDGSDRIVAPLVRYGLQPQSKAILNSADCQLHNRKVQALRELKLHQNDEVSTNQSSGSLKRRLQHNSQTPQHLLLKNKARDLLPPISNKKKENILVDSDYNS